MNLGKFSAVLGVCAVICIVVVGLSSANSDNASGPITYFIEKLVSHENVLNTPELRKSNVFDINEPNLRFLITVLTFVLSITAGIFAVLSAKNEKKSLWYSVGVYSSLSALSEINYYVAGIYIFICFILIMSSRKWKMTAA